MGREILVSRDLLGLKEKRDSPVFLETMDSTVIPEPTELTEKMEPLDYPVLMVLTVKLEPRERLVLLETMELKDLKVRWASPDKRDLLESRDRRDKWEKMEPRDREDPRECASLMSIIHVTVILTPLSDIPSQEVPLTARPTKILCGLLRGQRLRTLTRSWKCWILLGGIPTDALH